MQVRRSKRHKTLNYFDPAYFTTANYYFESDIKTSAGTGYAQLYNASDSAALSSSEVSTTGTTYSRQRSNILTMPIIGKTLDAQIKNSATNTTTVSSADLIIQAGNPPASEPTRRMSSSCISNNCIEFNGTDNSIKINNAPAIDLDTGLASGLTFSGWVKVISDGENHLGQIIAKGSNTYIRTANQGVDGYVDIQASLDLATSDATVNITDAVPINEWHYITLSYTDDADDEISIYIDGKLKGSSTNGSGAPAADSNDWYIGGSTDANFNGVLDELRLYAYERTGAQIIEDYIAKGSTKGVEAQLGGVIPTNQNAGPVAYYRFNENTGTSAADSSTNGNTATLNNGASWEPGKYGSGVRLDGTDDDVTAPSSSTLNIGSNDFTLMAWVKGNSMANGDVILGKTNGGSAASDYGFHFSVLDTLYPTLQFATSNTALTKIQGTTTLSNGQWYHVAVVVDRDSSTNTKMYINGISVTTTVDNLGTNTGSITNSFPLAIGNESDGGYNWDGSLDEVKIYTYARSQAEILQDMYASAPPVGMGLQEPLMHLAFDDGQGTTAKDRTSNAFDGTLTGMAAPATSTSGWTNDGKFGKAIVVDGTNDYVTTTVPWQSSGSMSVWVYPTSTGTDWVSPIGWKYAPASGGYTLIDVGSGGTKNWRAVFKPGSTAESNITGAAVQINTWQQVLMTWSQSGSTYTITLYVNGAKQGTTTWTGTPDTANIGPLYVGTAGQSANNNFTGRIDEAKVYSYALSDTEAKQEYNRGLIAQLGGTSTTSTGVPDNSSSRDYCVPGDTTSCSAPVAEWKLDENTGTTATDTSGNNNTGTLTNSPTWAPGRYGSAINLTPANSYISVPSASSLNITGDLTISAWVKPQTIDGTARLVLGKGDAAATTSRQYSIRLNASNQWQVLVYSGSSTYTVSDTTTTPSTSRWDHITLVRDATAGTLRLYTNGRLVNSASSVTGSLNSTSNILAIGREGATASNYFGGLVDGVRIYNYARTPQQVAWEYNRGLPLVQYRFDECQGTTAYNAATDGSGNTIGYNGTITIGASGTNTSAGSCKGTASEAWQNGSSGKFNSSLSFDGTDDSISVNSPSTLSSVSVNANRISFAFWFKPANISQSSYILSGRLSATNNKWWLIFYPQNGTYNGISMRINGSTQVSSPTGTNWSAGTWYHIVGVFDGTNITLYRDGQILGTGSSSGITAIDELVIGNVSA